MQGAYRNRIVQFDVIDGCLVRVVIDQATGKRYEQRCRREVFETVAHVIDETPTQGEGTTLTLISRGENLPFTQVNVALEFLKEHGVAVVRHRRCYPASACAFEDAMTEFCYLDEAPY